MKKIIIGLILIGLLVISFNFVDGHRILESFQEGKVIKEIFYEKDIPTPDIRDELNIRNHQYLTSRLEILGLSKEEAIKEAFNYQLREVALLQKANELGIEVTTEEVNEYVRNTRKLLETGIAENGDVVDNYKETLEQTEQFAEGLGLTVEQYWNEYAQEIAISTLKLRKLQVIHYKEFYEVYIEDWIDEIISDYQKTNSRKIQEFKNQIGLKQEI